MGHTSRTFCLAMEFQCLLLLNLHFNFTYVFYLYPTLFKRGFKTANRDEKIKQHKCLKGGTKNKQTKRPLGILLLYCHRRGPWVIQVALPWRSSWPDGHILLGSWTFGTNSACSECTVFPPGFAGARTFFSSKMPTNIKPHESCTSGQDVTDAHGREGKNKPNSGCKERIRTIIFDPERNLSSFHSDAGLFIYCHVSKAPNKHGHDQEEK